MTKFAKQLITSLTQATNHARGRKVGSLVRTRRFSRIVQSRAKTDKKFAEALLREGIDAMLSGDIGTGKTILRDYIKATVGFEKLGAATG